MPIKCTLFTLYSGISVPPPRLSTFFDENPPRTALLILSFKSTQNICFTRKFVFFLGGSSVSSAIDDNLDVFNEKMGQNFYLSWVVEGVRQIFAERMLIWWVRFALFFQCVCKVFPLCTNQKPLFSIVYVLYLSDNQKYPKMALKE